MHQGIFTNTFLFPELENVRPWANKTVKTYKMLKIEFKEEAIKKKYSNDRMLIPLAIYRGFCQVSLFMG